MGTQNAYTREDVRIGRGGDSVAQETDHGHQSTHPGGIAKWSGVAELRLQNLEGVIMVEDARLRMQRVAAVAQDSFQCPIRSRKWGKSHTGIVDAS